MKRLLGFLRRWRFLFWLLIFFLLADGLLGAAFDRYTLETGNFWLNDYELTRRDHPEPVWDKVFFGNSAVISAYREELSQSGYLNFGVDYGNVTALRDILRSREVHITGDLVLGLNWAALCDGMETNPNYFWNRGLLVPYCYFQRDRLSQALTGKLSALLTGKPWAGGIYQQQTKEHYFGSLSDQALTEKAAVYQQRYWQAGLQGCRDNLAALADVAALCGEKGIRLRVVLMPWNPALEKPALLGLLNETVAAACAEADVTLLDLTDAFDAECFYDPGHMNYEYGAYRFMEVIEPWLNS